MFNACHYLLLDENVEMSFDESWEGWKVKLTMTPIFTHDLKSSRLAVCCVHCQILALFHPPPLRADDKVLTLEGFQAQFLAKRVSSGNIGEVLWFETLRADTIVFYPYKNNPPNSQFFTNK